jgi:hypothetical protein
MEKVSANNRPNIENQPFVELRVRFKTGIFSLGGFVGVDEEMK